MHLTYILKLHKNKAEPQILENNSILSASIEALNEIFFR